MLKVRQFARMNHPSLDPEELGAATATTCAVKKLFAGCSHRPLPSFSAAPPAFPLLHLFLHQYGCRQLRPIQETKWAFRKWWDNTVLFRYLFYLCEPTPTSLAWSHDLVFLAWVLALCTSCCLVLLTYHLQFSNRSALAKRPRPIHPAVPRAW